MQIKQNNGKTYRNVKKAETQSQRQNKVYKEF